MGDVVTLSLANFEKEVLENSKTCLVDFWAPWCQPCKILGPIVEEVAGDAEYKDKLVVAKLDVAGAQELAAKYDVRGIPTLLLFKNGEVIDTKVGLVNKSELMAFIDRNLA
ncbi:MAG: thioredoxin [Thiotrichales bacterium]|nr:MAG: thioredoxin [Thiotrichales bacterium]